MHWHTPLLALLAFYVFETSAQGAVITHHRLNAEVTSDAWHFSNYPNPQTEPAKCGQPRPSWVCDPDSVLTPDQAHELDMLIKDIRKDTPCPCDEKTCAKNGAGYTITIAAINKMYRMREDHVTLVNDARHFAFSLQNERLQFDRCEEDIIILFSLKDMIVFSVTGRKAREVLQDDLLLEITMDSRSFFQHNPFMGLKHMLYGIRYALESKFHHYRNEKHHLSNIYSYRRITAASRPLPNQDGYILRVSHKDGAAEKWVSTILLTLAAVVGLRAIYRFV